MNKTAQDNRTFKNKHGFSVFNTNTVAVLTLLDIKEDLLRQRADIRSIERLGVVIKDLIGKGEPSREDEELYERRINELQNEHDLDNYLPQS